MDLVFNLNFKTWATCKTGFLFLAEVVLFETCDVT